jgi:hypothetical protein
MNIDWRIAFVSFVLLLSGGLRAEEAAPPLSDVDAGSEVDAGPEAESVERPEAIQQRYLTDWMELESTSIRGNQELPRVLYIVPWKDPSLGDLTGKPVNSLIDEVLEPLDRDVFLRQTKYFDQLYGAPENGTRE